MAESFGNSLTLVEVTSDDPEPTTQMWLAWAKPGQAVALVLEKVPEGWTADVVAAVFTERQLELFHEVRLKPGEVYKLAED